MDFFSVLTMFGGLALFLYGMNLMGDGLAKVSGGKLEGILARLTSSPIKAVILGAGVTAVIQSSSATTVMVVGFVNSGIMTLHQAVGIIMGANVGTTVTSWILSLSGIESDNFFVQLFKPTAFSPVLALIGVGLLMFAKSDRKKDVGAILIGFAILMFGMDTMSGAVEPLKDVPEFTSILTMFSNPVLGMVAGALLTAVIQSSSASVGILQALCATGSLSYSTVLPVIMGQNIGTCVTALLSGIGASKNAKRAAFVHLYFNLMGTLLFMVVFYTINSFHPFAFLEEAAGPAGIAMVHSLFNVGATIVLLPFAKVLERLATWSIRDDAEEQGVTEQPGTQADSELLILDERFLEKPAFAITQCEKATHHMAELAQYSLQQAVSLIWEYSKDSSEEVFALEEQIDHYEDALGSYLIKLSGRSPSQKDSQRIAELQHCIGDFERISDHALNIAQAVNKMQAKEMAFSSKASKELEVFSSAVTDIMDLTTKVFVEEDKTMAKCVEPLEEVIDKLNKEVKKRHVKRLRKGKCSVDMGFILADLSTDFERIADHCSNIAICIIQEGQEDIEAHEYLESLDKGEDTQFRESYLAYKEKYVLP
ncbi:MAG: Na/Pi cotransporter family protein [Lachnospiraceae bacterium]|nr:Na/Pi cotransporter family protein [Lachnospiraceae bacterium]